jgi:hypothetical protein
MLLDNLQPVFDDFVNCFKLYPQTNASITLRIIPAITKIFCCLMLVSYITSEIDACNTIKL